MRSRAALIAVVSLLALSATVARAQSQLFPEARPAAPSGPPLPAVIYTIEQIAIAQPAGPDLFQALEATHSLQQAEDVLKVRGIPFNWRRLDVGSASLPPELSRRLASLPPHEVFIIPLKAGATLGVIVQQRPAPPMP